MLTGALEKPFSNLCYEKNMNYTPLSFTPLDRKKLEKNFSKHKKNSFDGVLFSLSLMTITTLAAVIYVVLEKRLLTGL